MHRSQLRFLLFYGGTLAIVILLFRSVTAYGEANLITPPTLNEHYLSTTAPPGCEPSRVRLTIQQSGIYLNGAIHLQSETETTAKVSHIPERLTLIGRWQEQLILNGRTQAFTACPFSLIDPQQPITLQATLNPDQSLTGQIQQANAVWTFTAQPQQSSTAQSEGSPPTAH